MARKIDSSRASKVLGPDRRHAPRPAAAGPIRFWVWALVAALLALAGPTRLVAQIVTATILGTVEDPQGAVIPNASISARNLGTGAVRTAATNTVGDYRIPSLPVGTYEVTASAPGFKTEIRSGITLTVGADVPVNFTLSVGSVAEKVEISAEAPLVNTADSTLSQLVDQVKIRELPLNGRDWVQLAILQAGVVPQRNQRTSDSGRTQAGNGMAISVSGGRTSENNFRLNGMTINDYANNSPGSGLGINLGVDSVLEFSVLTNTPPAEYGRTSGGVVNAVTKSGTNAIHGSSFYFHRNSALDARNFFDGARVPPFRRHQFGGSVGGPIKKDKTFFFANYEALRELLSLSFSANTLSENARSGVLTSGPVTLAQEVKPYLQFYPLPNIPTNRDTGQFLSSGARLAREDFVTGRMDHQFSSKDSLNGIYLYDNAKAETPDSFQVKSTRVVSARHNVALSETHLFNERTIHNVRAGLSRTYAANNIAKQVFKKEILDPALAFVPGLPVGRISVPGLDTMPGGPSTGGSNIFHYTSFQFYDDLSWLRGSHSWKFGAAVERIRYNLEASDDPTGRFTFGSLRDFLTARPNGLLADLPNADTVRGERQTLLSFYAMDDYRLRPRLTLNLGLRYEFATVVTEAKHKLSNLRHLGDPTPAIGDPYFENPTLRNFEPRVGFAWDVFGNGKTSVRGGVGIFDILPLPYLFVNKMPRSFPFFKQGFIALNPGNPIPGVFPHGAFNLLAADPTTASVQGIQFNPSRAYKAQWNLNVQREVLRNFSVTLAYVGGRAVHLPRQIVDLDVVPNPQLRADGRIFFPPGSRKLNPNFGRITSVLWDADSHYHGLQLTTLRRFSRGLQFQTSYTWSKSIDTASHTFSDSETGTSIGDPWPLASSLNRGLSDFDTRHNLILNFRWDVPTPANWPGAAKTILGGWELGGIYTISSGTPFSVLMGFDNAGTLGGLGLSTNLGQRPDLVANPGCTPNAINPGNPTRYVKTECFAPPPPRTIGTLGRNTLIGPGLNNFDFSLFKNHRISRIAENFNAQFRAEFFNLFNRANFQSRRWDIFQSGGALVSSVGRFTPPTATTSRQIQLGLKFIW